MKYLQIYFGEKKFQRVEVVISNWKNIDTLDESFQLA